MEILIRAERRIQGLENRRIKTILKKVLNDLGYHDSELSILLTHDGFISELNERYLGRQGPTNVLAFPMKEEKPIYPGPVVLGDVVISLDTAEAEAINCGESVEETVLRLLIHGVLHLLGYDHEGSPEEADRMESEERRLLELVLKR